MHQEEPLCCSVFGESDRLFTHYTSTFPLTLQLCHKPLGILWRVIENKQVHIRGFVIETEGSAWEMQKRTLFHNKKVKKGTPNLTSTYVLSFFTSFLVKQIFEKISHQGQRPEAGLSFNLKEPLCIILKRC